METTKQQVARLIRARTRMESYVKGLSTEDRRAARRAIAAKIDFLTNGRRIRIKRGPPDSRKETRPSYGWAQSEKRDGRNPGDIPSSPPSCTPV
jgi:hypothetical protein